MLTGLLHAHSGLRYLVLVVGVLALGWAVIGHIRGVPYDRTMRGLASAFAGLLHFQVLLGFILIVTGRFYPALIGHIFLMLGAAAAAQVPLSVFRRRPPEKRTYLPHVISILAALGLVWAGVAAIGRGILESQVF